MSTKIDRILTKTEFSIVSVVHKTDLRPENLMLLSELNGISTKN